MQSGNSSSPMVVPSGCGRESEFLPPYGSSRNTRLTPRFGLSPYSEDRRFIRKESNWAGLHRVRFFKGLPRTPWGNKETGFGRACPSRHFSESRTRVALLGHWSEYNRTPACRRLGFEGDRTALGGSEESFSGSARILLSQPELYAFVCRELFPA